MLKPSQLAAAVTGALAFFAAGAQAVTCDIVIDRTGAVVYQDVTPPVDMSDRGAVARERMRQRGEQLMIIDTEQCPRLVFSSISGVTGAASVEEIVSGMRPYIGATGGMGFSARPSASGGISTAPASPVSTQQMRLPAGAARPY